MADNLDTVLTAINNEMKLEHIRFGFIHQEPHGVIAIDQKGGGSGLKQTRLYVYPDTSTRTLFLLTIGDKNTQKADIKLASDFAKALIQKRQEEHD